MITTPSPRHTTDTKPQDLLLLYTAEAHTIGGRDGGASRTSDGRLDVTFSVPDGPGSGTNPEQLLAAGWSACFLSGIKNAAGKKKIRLPDDVAVDVAVALFTDADGFSLQARLNVSLPGLDYALAQELVEHAHQSCPYSKATRGNIPVAVNLV